MEDANSKVSTLSIVSFVGGALSVVATLLIGVADLAVLPSRYEGFEQIPLLDRAALDLILAGVNSYIVIVGVVAAAIGAFAGDLYYRHRGRDRSDSRRYGVVLLMALIFALIVLAFWLVILAACRVLDTYYHLLLFVILLGVPGGLAWVGFLAARKRNDGLALSYFGICVSVAAIYLSGLFFLIPGSFS